MNGPKVLLAAWAALRYDPAPSAWTLRQWAREGDIHPAPEKVGRDWYVDPTATRLVSDAPAAPRRRSVVDRVRAGA